MPSARRLTDGGGRPSKLKPARPGGDVRQVAKAVRVVPPGLAKKGGLPPGQAKKAGRPAPPRSLRAAAVTGKATSRVAAVKQAPAVMPVAPVSRTVKRAPAGGMPAAPVSRAKRAPSVAPVGPRGSVGPKRFAR